MKMLDRNKKSLVVFLILLAVLVLLVVVATYKPWRGSTTETPIEFVSSSDDSNAPASSQRNQEGLTPGREDASPSTGRGKNTAAELEAVEGAEVAQQRIAMFFQTASGNPVPGWRFSYALLDYSTTIAEIRGDVSALQRRFEATKQAVSDSAGHFELVEGRDFEGFKVYAVWVKGLDEGYSFEGQGSYPGDLSHGEYGFTVPELGGETVITLLATRTVSFTIEYADGVPYEGRVGVSSPVPSNRGRSISVVGGAISSFELPPVRGSFSIGCYADRPGFKATNSWAFAADETPPYLKLVIPEDQNQCTITVNLERWTEGEPVEIRIYNRGTALEVEDVATGGSNWRTLRMTGDGVPYLITATGSSGTWRSEVFSLRHGDIREFIATPGSPIRVRARLTTLDGTPLRGGCINALPDAYPNWSTLTTFKFERGFVKTKGILAHAGADGVVELGDLPAGGVELAFEAVGYEVVRRHVNGAPGELVDLGDIFLSPAEGRIELDLLNRRPDVGYSVWVNGKYGAGTVLVLKDVKQDKVVIEHLALRTYQLFVCAGDGGDGGPVPNPVIDLSDGNVARLTIDVNGWRTTAERQAE